jgi:hypothetical protein
MQVCLATLDLIKFFQKKKKKKRKPVVQVEGFRKTGFFKKILPDMSTEEWA